MRQHIGVGQSQRVKQLEIFWPVSNTRQRFKNVPIDRTFHVTEGRDHLDRVATKTFEIGKTKIANLHREHQP
jgi:hypothetical protein